MRNKTFFAALVGALVLGVAGMASAGQVSKPQQLNMTIEGSCLVDSYDAYFTATGVNATEENPIGVNVMCNTGTTYTVSPDNGVNYGINPDAVDQRAVVDGSGNSIPYQLFQGLDMLPWGVGPEAYSGVGNGDWQPLEFSVRFNRVNYAPSGTYNDTLTSTVDFL